MTTILRPYSIEKELMTGMGENNEFENDSEAEEYFLKADGNNNKDYEDPYYDDDNKIDFSKINYDDDEYN